MTNVSGRVLPHAVKTAYGATFSYDQNGNRLTDNLRTFTWDPANRLASVTKGSSITTFVYGADGARVKKVASCSSFVSAIRSSFLIHAATLGRYSGRDVIAMTEFSRSFGMKRMVRAGSVCLNRLRRFAKWISASIMPPPSSVPAC